MVDGSSDFRVRGNVIGGFHGSDALGERFSKCSEGGGMRLSLHFFRAQ